MMVSSVPTTKKIVFLFLLTLGFSISSAALSQTFIIKLYENSSFVDSISQIKSEQNLSIIDTHKKGRLVLVDFKKSFKNKNLIANKINSINKMDEVEYIVENIKFKSFDTPNDPKFSSQWALEKVSAVSAWDQQKGDPAITVAVIDTGVDLKHEDLSAHIHVNKGEIPNNNKDDDQNGYVDDTHGWDFKDNDKIPHDETSDKNPGHGTHCAGIIGAVGDNGTGISGMAQQVTIMPIRFLGADGSGDLMSAAKAIDYATENGADIISASWGAAVSRSGVKPILEAMERAQTAGIIFVAAAANDGKSNDSREVYPANAGYDNVISVAASDPQDKKPSWSNYGTAKVDISSPGLNILSTIPGNKYQNLSGTSMATPLVAGATALLLSQAKVEGKSYTPLEIRSILQSTGVEVAIETACECRIDVAKALGSIKNNALTVVPNALSLEIGKTKTFHGLGGKEPYQFVSSNPEVASIDNDGLLTAQAKGEAVINLTDAVGTKVSSHSIHIGKTSGGGGGNTECPFGPYCDVMCKIDPSYPWCN